MAPLTKLNLTNLGFHSPALIASQPSTTQPSTHLLLLLAVMVVLCDEAVGQGEEECGFVVPSPGEGVQLGADGQDLRGLGQPRPRLAPSLRRPLPLRRVEDASLQQRGIGLEDESRIWNRGI